VSLEQGLDTERASARYNDGVLRLVLPKAAHTRARQVKVAVK
jgi:HSP20 family molecular chaperone IbpA